MDGLLARDQCGYASVLVAMDCPSDVLFKWVYEIAAPVA